MSKIVLLVLLVLFSVQTKCNKYCDIKCSNKEMHTMCARDGCPIASAGEDIEQHLLTEDDKSILLQVHNEYRNKLAKYGHKSLPKATNMNILKWDSELETVAQCWANSCNGPKHDLCRNVERFLVGQNIAILSAHKVQTLLGQNRLNTSVTMWFLESDNFNSGIEKYEFDHATGHFTQLVWAETLLVGCGRAFYKMGDYIRYVLVCNYGPSGNIIGECVYESGEPCSKCKNGCNTQFTGLCH